MKSRNFPSLLFVTYILLTSCSNTEERLSATPESTSESTHQTRTIAAESQPSKAKTQEAFGHFLGKVQTEWLDGNREMKLLSTLSYIDPNGITWVAPKDSKIDGASIPQVLWSMIGSPFSGQYRNASVIHDVACVEKRRSWQATHLAFYNAMRASGVAPLRAKIMYAAVNNFGPRWNTSGVRGGGSQEQNRLSEADFEQLVAAIEQGETSGQPMSVEQIQNFQK